MGDIPSLSNTEALILQLLIGVGESYGLDLVKRSDGKLKRGTVYVTLQRMEEKGFLTSRQEAISPDPNVGIPRRLYTVTGLGQRVLDAREMVGSYLLGDAP